MTELGYTVLGLGNNILMYICEPERAQSLPRVIHDLTYQGIHLIVYAGGCAGA